MDVKSLLGEINPLRNKIVENGNNSFKLWLEFEDSGPWDDLENDFANIGVDTLDGRSYGINIWTIKYLNTAHNLEKQDGNHNYVIPPDLFVKELTRECIEEIIKELLNEGNLEDILNHSVFGLNFINPFIDAMDLEENLLQSLINTLKQEFKKDHFLSNLSYELIAIRKDNDDMVLELDDGRIAVICLSTHSKNNTDQHSLTRIYHNEIDFWYKDMKQAILDKNEL